MTPAALHLPFRLFPLVLVSFLALSAQGCKPGQTAAEETPPAPIPVETADVSRQPILATWSGTAALEAVSEASVVARTSGVLLELLIEEGSLVREGQVVARIDDVVLRNELAQAQAILRKTQASYDMSERAVRTGLIPRSQYDQDKYDLETQTAVVAGKQLQVGYTRVVAPISGVVARRDVKIGAPVQANEVLMHIVDTSVQQAVLNVPERHLQVLAPGQAVQMRLDALDGRLVTGVVARISPVVDAASGTFRVTCEFSGADGQLKPGMFGRVEIVHDRREDALVIPRSALVDEDGELSVFRIEDALQDAEGARPLARRQVVEAGHMQGDLVEIRDGLDDRDRVITVGRAAVRDGTAVLVLQDTP